jgi:hypothetical protein
MSDPILNKNEKILKEVSSSGSRIVATDKRLIIEKRLPHSVLPFTYHEVGSIEQKKVLRNGSLINGLVLAGLAGVTLGTNIVYGLMDQLFLDLRDVMSIDVFLAPTVTLALGAVFAAFSAYNLIKFALSIRSKLVIYPTGRKAIAIGVPANNDTAELIKIINERVKQTEGLTKDELKEAIQEELEKMLLARKGMEEDILRQAKAAARTATTEEQKQKVRAMLEESMAKLQKQDEELGARIEKSGLSKEEVFKKYRIKPPNEGFIDEVLKESSFDELNKK